MPFSKILIANRGEIAVRIMRTAKALGYRTVAVHSPADAGALHTQVADETIAIGGNLPAESYLRADLIIAAARQCGADAIHPGYGFLSENAAFAAACEQAGIVFIGPTPVAIDAMGNKRQAKLLMIKAGVPCVPGYEGADQSDNTLVAEGKRIGAPIMVKAAAGGGGRGMRLVTDLANLAEAIAAARSEAQNAFGSGELILEKAVVDARHVEIQVFADSHGNAIHLGERDCSIQRRHQKIVEESPSPAVDAALRQRMGAAAVKAAKIINYRGAGTVEFLLGADKKFYFLEMNTRLQVEHPVTEMVTGLDLVAWQIKIAQGGKLPLSQDQVRLNGHAIEVRLYAEDAYGGFLPQAGKVAVWNAPEGDGLRTDHGLAAGQIITPFYDPMIAKVIAWGETREQARQRLVRAIEDCEILGPVTNKHFLAATLRHASFADGSATTAFIGNNFPSETLSQPAPPAVALIAATLFHYRRTRHAIPESVRDFRNSHNERVPLKLQLGEQPATVDVQGLSGGSFAMHIGEHNYAVQLLGIDGYRLRFSVDGVKHAALGLFEGDALIIDAGGFASRCTDISLQPARRAGGAGDGKVVAPMDGRIVAVRAAPGDKVEKGQVLVVLEAMKMQHQIRAKLAGTVQSVNVREGDQVSGRALLAQVAISA